MFNQYVGCWKIEFGVWNFHVTQHLYMTRRNKNTDVPPSIGPISKETSQYDDCHKFKTRAGP